MKRALTAAALALTLVIAGCGSENESAAPVLHSAPDTTSAPDQTQWAPVAGILSPVESTDGPRETEPVLSGYEHTPQGAVVAAINGQVAMATTDDATWPEVSQFLLAPGEGRDQWAQGRALMSIQAGAVVNNPASFEGFRITSYEEETAQVVLATEYPEVGLTAYPVQLVWQGDWKIVLPTQYDSPDLEKIDSLDGFTPYSATE